MLTDAACRKVKPEAKVIRIADGGSLYLVVQPSGTKTWQFAYRFNGKHRTMGLGAYPKIGLADARKQRERAKDMIKAGRDPQDARDGIAEDADTFTVAIFFAMRPKILAQFGAHRPPVVERPQKLSRSARSCARCSSIAAARRRP